MRKASVKLVESSVWIVGVLKNLVIATGRYGSKIQDPKCRRSPRSLIESSQESEGSGPGIIQHGLVRVPYSHGLALTLVHHGQRLFCSVSIETLFSQCSYYSVLDRDVHAVSFSAEYRRQKTSDSSPTPPLLLLGVVVTLCAMGVSGEPQPSIGFKFCAIKKEKKSVAMAGAVRYITSFIEKFKSRTVDTLQIEVVTATPVESFLIASHDILRTAVEPLIQSFRCCAGREAFSNINRVAGSILES
jgi:hypothetical protein